jgi:hypothetical protein
MAEGVVLYSDLTTTYPLQPPNTYPLQPSNTYPLQPPNTYHRRRGNGL